MRDVYRIADIAELLKVPRNTVDSWRFRGLLPPESRWVRGSPVWDRATVLAFAEKWVAADGRPGQWEGGQTMSDYKQTMKGLRGLSDALDDIAAGRLVTCGTCGRSEPARGEFFRKGWPKCHGLTMILGDVIAKEA